MNHIAENKDNLLREEYCMLSKCERLCVLNSIDCMFLSCHVRISE